MVTHNVLTIKIPKNFPCSIFNCKKENATIIVTFFKNKNQMLHKL